MIGLVLVSVHEVLALGSDGWSHVAIDHVAVWLLWGAWVQLGVLLNLLDHWLTWGSWWAGSAVHGLLLAEEGIEGVGDTGHVRCGVLAEQDLRGTVKLVGQLQDSLADLTILVIQNIMAAKNATSQGN